MEDYKVIHAPGISIPDRIGALLFNRNQYFSIFKNYEIHQFLLESRSGKPLAKLNVALYGKTAFNPLLAPFGGIEFDGKLDINSLEWFLSEIKSTANSLGWENVRITNFPEAYNYDQYKLLEKSFLNAGFERIERQPNWLFFLDEPIVAHHIKNDELEFVYEEEFDLQDIFKFISEQRPKQGYEFRLGFEDFFGFFTALPESHTLFVLKNKGKIIAVLTGVLVTDQIMYAFPAAYNPEEATLDQMLFFYRCLFTLLKENGFHLFDVGTIFNTQDKLIFNQLGAIKSYKNTFEVEI